MYKPYKNRVTLSKRKSLSHKRLSDMKSDELLDTQKLIDEEIVSRGLGMLFG